MEKRNRTIKGLSVLARQMTTTGTGNRQMNKAFKKMFKRLVRIEKKRILRKKK